MKDSHFESQLKKERLHLQVFSSLYPIPGKEIFCESIKKPDFRFEDGGNIIGIEHTGLYLINMVKLKNDQRKIVLAAKGLAEKNMLPPLEVRVVFHDYFKIEKLKRNQIACALYSIVESNLQMIIKANNGHSVKIIPPKPFVGINSIRVTFGEYEGKTWLHNHRWLVDETGFVKQNMICDLQARIDEKNEVINDYLKNCSSCWLLVVFDRSKADQKYNIIDNNFNHVFNAIYSKIFLLEISEKKLFQLKLA
jgi:hypothetical protein